MKNILLIIIGFGIGINSLYSQWTQTDGPYDNSDVLVAFKHDSTYYASTKLSGFFSKTPLGNSWNLHSNFHFKAYTIIGDSLIADAHYFSGGMDRSKGLLLFDLKNPNIAPQIIRNIETEVLCHTENGIYYGLKSGGFGKMNLDGSGYTAYNNGLPAETVFDPYGTHLEPYEITAIEVTDDYFYAGTVWGIFRSDHNLNLWERVGYYLPFIAVSSIKEIQDTLYATINNNLHYSTNNGDLWNLMCNAPSNITSFHKENNEIYLSTNYNGILYSTDNGTSWNSMNIGLTDLSVNFIEKLDSTFFCGTKTGGIFKYENNIWTDNNPGMISSTINSMTVANNQIIANSRNKVYNQSSNDSWTNISPYITYDFFSSLASTRDTIFLSIKSSTFQQKYIMYSENNGTSWHNLNNPVPFTRDDPYKIYCDNGNLYAYEDEILYSTNNLGISWTDIRLPSQYCNNFTDFVVYNSIPFASACGFGEFLKLDNNSSWVLTTNGFPEHKDTEKIAYCDSALFAFVTNSSLYVSFDNGINWLVANNILPLYSTILDFASSGNKLFITTEKGVYGTNNFGQDWYVCNDGLKNLNISSLEILNDTLYAGTIGNGIWKRAIYDIALSTNEPYRKKPEITIYPNPANDYIIIDNNIKIKHIKIIDLLGKQILSERFLNNKIDIQIIPNGAYIIVLSSDEKDYTSKVIINR